MGSSHSKAKKLKGFKKPSTGEEASTGVKESTTVESVEKPNLPRRRDHPLEWEVLYVRRCLLFFVPVELVDLIIEYAEYWPRILDYTEDRPAFTLPPGGETSNNSHWFYVISGLIDYEEEDKERQELRERWENKRKRKEKKGKKKTVSKVAGEEKPKPVRVAKKVVFKIWSHDQGWGAVPDLLDYEASWTWFEAAIFPREAKDPFWNRDYPLLTDLADPPTVPPRELGMWKIWHLQSNVRAKADEALHEIVWTERDDESQPSSWKETGRGAGTGFVRSLRAGNRIAVVVRARFPGWVNYVRRVEVEVFYSVY